MNKQNFITMQLIQSDTVKKENQKFPDLTMTLKPQRLDSYLEKITGYSFAATMVVMLAFFGMLN
jgi:hypothetical protein